MKWLAIFLLAFLAGMTSATTSTISNDITYLNAEEHSTLHFEASPFRITGIINGHELTIKPQMNTTSGISEISTLLSTYPTARAGGYVIKGYQDKFAFNFTLPTLAANAIRSIPLVISSKDIDFKKADFDKTRIYYAEGFYIDFSDLLAGFSFKIINASYVIITGITGKTIIDLDPTVYIYNNNVKTIFDTYMVNGASANNNYGASTGLGVGTSGTPAANHALIAYNVTSMVPSDAIINSICLNFPYIIPDTMVLSIERPMKLWYEGSGTGAVLTTQTCGATWNSTCYNNTKSENWTDQGMHLSRGVDSNYDVFTHNMSSITLAGVEASITKCDSGGNLTQLVQLWVNGTEDWRKGIMIQNATPSGSLTIYSSDTSLIYNRPNLFINYTENLTINAEVTGAGTASSPFSISAEFLNGNGGYGIFGGKLTNYKITSNDMFQFRFANLSSLNNKNDIWAGGSDTGNTTWAVFANDTIKYNGSTADGSEQFAWDVLDVNDDGIDEIATSNNLDDMASCKVIYANGTLAWQTIARGDCQIVKTYDFNQDGYKDVLFTSTGINNDNLTVYHRNGTPMYTISNFSGNVSYNNVREVEIVPNMYNEGETELGVGFGGSSGTVGIGVAVYYAKNGTFKYRMNTTTTSGRRMNALTAIDAGMKGYKNMWVAIRVSRNYWLMNRSSNSPYGTATEIFTSGTTYEVEGADLDGDGYENEFVTYSDGVFAYTVNASGQVRNLWNYTSPFMLYNQSGQAAWIFNNLRVADINDDGNVEVIVFTGTGWYYVFNGNGTLLVEAKSPDEYVFGTGSTTAVGFGKSQALDLSKNQSNNANIIGFASASIYSSNGTIQAYEWEPCSISIAGSPYQAMKWNASSNEWAIYNSTGLSAGTHTYNISCDGNFSGHGKKNFNGTFTITGGEPSTISFTVFTLGGGGNFTTSMETSPGNSTEAIYFNSTSMYAWWVVPCANGDATTNCQNGTIKPIYSVVNTGTLNIGFYSKLSSGLSGTNIKLCANSTTGTFSPACDDLVSVCDLSGTEGNLNASQWLLLGSVPATARLNITLYANFSGAYGGVHSRINYHNSTT